MNVAVTPQLAINCEVDDYLWPWEQSTPVVMVHGYLRNAGSWRRWVPRIAEKRRVYRPEARGFGRSPVPPGEVVFDTAQITGDLLRVLDTFGLARVHLVGDSSGGLCCVLFALQYPERVASIVLCDTPLKGTESSTPEIRERYAIGEANTAAAIRKYGVEEWCRRTLAYRLDLDRASPEFQEWYVRELGTTPVEVAIALNTYLHPAQGTLLQPGDVGRIEAPVLLLGGAKSKLSGDQQQKLVGELRHGSLYAFEGYGHGVSVLAPEECARRAVAFWDAL